MFNFFKKKEEFKKINEVVFNDIFPESKVQPSWDYFDKKRVIKIKLNKKLINFLNKNDNFSFDELFELKIKNKYLIDIDINLFKKFGDIFIYTNESNGTNGTNESNGTNGTNESNGTNRTNCIHVYTLDQKIDSSDFNPNFNFIFNKCTLEYKNYKIDLTEYLHSFRFNEFITPEILLLFYDNFNEDLDFILLKINFDWCTKILLLKQKIKFT